MAIWQTTVREWLEREQRSQAWLARKAGMDTSYVSACLNDLRRPGAKALRKLELAMGLAPGTLERVQAQSVGSVNGEDSK